jgi:hypothetical protein
MARVAAAGGPREVQPTLRLLLGTAALLVSCDEYRDQLCGAAQGRAPAVLAMDERSRREAITSALREIFRMHGQDWGEPRLARTWAFWWELECIAVRSALRCPKRLVTWPMGPMLCREVSAPKDLVEVLREPDEVRHWYGPWAGARLLQQSLMPLAALEALDAELDPDMCWPVYGEGGRALELLASDRRALRIEVLRTVITRRLPSTQHPLVDDRIPLTHRVSQCIDAIIERHGLIPGRYDADVAKAARSLLQMLSSPMLSAGQNAGRRPTVEEGEGLLECTEIVLRQIGANDDIQYRRLFDFRSKLCMRLGWLRFEEWDKLDPESAVMKRILELAERAVDTPAPGNREALLNRLQVKWLWAMTLRDAGRAAQERNNVLRSTALLMDWANTDNWPERMKREVKAFRKLIESAPPLSREPGPRNE